MSTHPAEVNEALALAYAKCDRLISDAEKRGDRKGSDAWLVARGAIKKAEEAMQEARTKQNWSRHDAPRCASCGNPKDDHPYRHPFVERK